MPKKRCADPIFLQYIWDSLDYCYNALKKPNLSNIVEFITKEKDSKASFEKIRDELNNCIEDGCLQLSHDSEYLKIPHNPDDKQNGSKHDWYCYECHGPKCNFYCDKCYRAYHRECILDADEGITSNLIFPPEDSLPKYNLHDGTCPICARSKLFYDYECKREDLQEILAIALNNVKNKNHWKLLAHIGYVNDPIRNSFLLLREINTKIIGRKMRLDSSAKTYANRNELLLDLDQLVHNTAIIYGMKNDMCQSARQIRCQLRRQMRESYLCIDCYVNTGKSGRAILKTCRNDHKIIWFQHNGWSFWPCKVLHSSPDGYEVVRFGGRHERTFVPKDRGVDFVFSASEMGLRITPALKKALDEVEEYRKNRERKSLLDQSKSAGLSSYQKKPDKSHSDQPTNSLHSNTITTHQEIRPRKSKLSDTYLCNSSNSSASSSPLRAENEDRPARIQNYPQKTERPFRSRSSSLSSLTLSENSESEKASKTKQFAATLANSQNGEMKGEKKKKKKSSLIVKIRPLPYPNEEFNEASMKKSLFSSSISTASTSSTVCPRLDSENVDLNIDRLQPVQIAGNKAKRKSDQNKSSLPNTIHRTSQDHKKNSNGQKRKSEPISYNEQLDKVKIGKKSDKHDSATTKKRQMKSFKEDDDLSLIPSELSSDDDEHSSCLSTVSTSHNKNNLTRYSSSKSVSRYEKNDNNLVIENLSQRQSENNTPTNVSPEIIDNRMIMPSPDKLNPSRKQLNSDYSSLSGSTTPIQLFLDNGRSSNKYNSPEKYSLSTNFGNQGQNYYGNSSTVHNHGTSNHVSHPTQQQTLVSVNSVSPAALSSSSSSGIGSCCLSEINAKSVDASPCDQHRSYSLSRTQSSIPGNLTSSQSASNLQMNRMVQNLNTPKLDSAFIKAIEDRVAGMFQERITSLTLERDMVKERNAQLEKNMAALKKDHDQEIVEVKRKCWCIVCLTEANYHCCAAISYCSQVCQLEHWKKEHSKSCKRVAH